MFQDGGRLDRVRVQLPPVRVDSARQVWGGCESRWRQAGSPQGDSRVLAPAAQAQTDGNVYSVSGNFSSNRR